MKESGDRRQVRVADLIKAKMCMQQKRLLREINPRLAEMKNIFGRNNERRVINMHVAAAPFHPLSAAHFICNTHLFIHVWRQRESQAVSTWCQSTF